MLFGYAAYPAISHSVEALYLPKIFKIPSALYISFFEGLNIRAAPKECTLGYYPWVFTITLGKSLKS